ncbi:MAG: hypothetical protein E6G78_06325 [Alphaproteobacteria bacterium]|nr:MAG: hypothetical protein E6G78_06325 [Alphaproteobacteria bacterium]
MCAIAVLARCLKIDAEKTRVLWLDRDAEQLALRGRGVRDCWIALDATLLRPRYGRLAKHAAADKVVPSAVGHRHGRRSRSLTGTFGRVEIEVPRARLEGANGKTTEWQSTRLEWRASQSDFDARHETGAVCGFRRLLAETCY